MELALEVERAARARKGVTQVENAVYSDADGSVALANSRGFAACYRATQAWAYASAFAGEGADLMTGLGVDMGRSPSALDPEAIGAEAAERALALVGARQPESRRCPVVLDAFVAASFMGFIGAMLSADAVQRGRSLFAGREGEDVADPALRLADDGTDSEGPGSARSTARAPHPPDRPDRGRPPARLPLRLAHREEVRPREHRQREPRLLPLAAVGGDHEPGDRARRGTSPAWPRLPATGST